MVYFLEWMILFATFVKTSFLVRVFSLGFIYKPPESTLSNSNLKSLKLNKWFK